MFNLSTNDITQVHGYKSFNGYTVISINAQFII